MNSTNRKHPGFTLIELLVVVAIIAVLISILLPALSRAKQQARQLECNAQLRSMGQAMMLYADEYNGTIVRSDLEPTPASEDKIMFAVSLLKGLGYDGKITGIYGDSLRETRQMRDLFASIPTFQCPTHPVPEQQLDYIVNAFPMVYTQNNVSRDVAGGGSPADGSGGARSDVQTLADYTKFFNLDDFGRYSPSQFIYVTEGHSSLPTMRRQDFALYDVFYASHLSFAAYPRISNDRRHPGGVNAVFFDGHASTLGFDRIDAGWPEPLSKRLRHFTVVPPELDQGS